MAVRFASSAAPDRSEHGETGPLEWAEGRLTAGSQRLALWDLQVSADLAGESAEFSTRVRNGGDEPRHLESVTLGFRWKGIAEGALGYLKNGWQSWSYTGGRPLTAEGDEAFPSGPWMRGLHHPLAAPPPDRSGWHESSQVSVARDAEGRSCLAGVFEGGTSSALVYWKLDGGEVRVEVELHLGIPVDPGQAISLETVLLALGPNENVLLERFAEGWAHAAEARASATLPVGWCSWYQFFHDVTEDDILRNLDALNASRSEFPVGVVQIDDGYQSQIGDWLATNEKFPRGLAPLAADISAAGFRPGLWTAPFCAVAESETLQTQRDWFLRNFAVGDELQRGLLHPTWTGEGWVHALDTSQVAVHEYLTATFRELTEMGFTYHKLDFLWVVAAQARALDPSLTPAQRLRAGLDAVREGVGEDSFLLGCGCPMGPAVGVVDAMRIGPDVAPHWWPPQDSPAGFEEALPSTRSALRSILSRAWMHRRLWINDPDCLMARTRDTELTEAEVDALAGAIAATAGMPVISDDLPSLDSGDRQRVVDTLLRARTLDAAAATGAARAVGLLEGEVPLGVDAVTAEERWSYRLNVHEEDESADLLGEAMTLGPHESALRREPREVRLGVFCDYDGTFAIQDVGSTLAKTYAGERRVALWDRLASGELNAWSYNMELLDGLELPEETLEAFLQTVEPTPGAAELVQWCEDHAVPFRVLSDGFDRNLDRLQEIHGIRFDYDANKLWYEKGRWRLAPGSPDPTCGCGTGVCKAARIAEFRTRFPNAEVVHIGNGRVSDLCASETADRVFAKDSLAEELQARGVAFEPFLDLHQVREALGKSFFA